MSLEIPLFNYYLELVDVQEINRYIYHYLVYSDRIFLSSRGNDNLLNINYGYKELSDDIISKIIFNQEFNDTKYIIFNGYVNDASLTRKSPIRINNSTGIIEIIQTKHPKITIFKSLFHELYIDEIENIVMNTFPNFDYKHNSIIDNKPAILPPYPHRYFNGSYYGVNTIIYKNVINNFRNYIRNVTLNIQYDEIKLKVKYYIDYNREYIIMYSYPNETGKYNYISRGSLFLLLDHLNQDKHLFTNMDIYIEDNNIIELAPSPTLERIEEKEFEEYKSKLSVIDTSTDFLQQAYDTFFKVVSRANE